jgi:hypothetical protein
MVMKRIILAVIVLASLAVAPSLSSFAQDNYRHRDTDDRMGGSTRAKATMQRYGEDQDKPVRKPTSSTTKKKAVEPVEEEASAPPTPSAKPNTEESSSEAVKEEEAAESEEEQPVLKSADSEETTAETAQEAVKEPEDQIVVRPDKPARVPAVLKVNYTALESLGTLHNANSGSLGIDLWDGSTRNQILQLVNQLPPPRHYGILQRMNQRALLTSADATMMGNRSGIQAGEDFQTVRIEKLLDTGSYLQAAQLYMADQAVAYHERLARAGVQSLFLSRQPTIACLETKTMMVRFDDQPFWNQASVICDYILGKMAGQVMKGFVDRAEVKPIVAESKVMGYVFDKPGYKVQPRNFDDLKDYTPLETALLLNDNRLSLSKFDASRIEAAPSHAIGVLMMAPDASGELKLQLWSEALRRGMITPTELGDLYAGVKLNSKDLQQAKGWLVVPAYYQAMNAARDKDQKKKLGLDALKLASQYPAGALTPFAEYLPNLSAEGLDGALIRRIAHVGALAGTPVSRSVERDLWNQAESATGNSEALTLALSNAALKNFSTEEMPKEAEFQQLTGKLPETSKSLVFAVIEKLDTAGKLHNISGEVAYEKPDGLTDSTDYDYVMPSSDLMENLSSAQKDKRLGEVILLSSIAIGDIPPSKMDPKSVAEVIDGLKTVGLTSEARELASEVIMGLSTEK